uniref:Hypothetical conserved protein n=1 Tax=uncultured prokaryote TaxID=198431 RepID=H5S8Z5_9ZZZZ|nr:hypothetical conserved protein [uncultured prokaryote]
MPRPTGNQLRVDVPLTNISIAYIQDASQYIAEKIFPRVPVKRQSDRVPKYDKASWLAARAQPRAPGSESAGGGYKVDLSDTYFAVPYSFHKDVNDQDRANTMAPFDADRDATQFVTDVLLKTREILFVHSYFATGVWGYERQGVASSPGAGQFLQWDQSTSDPIGDISDAKNAILETTGFLPNVLALDYKTYEALRNHPLVLDRVKFGGAPGNPATVNAQALAQLFDVEEVVIGQAVVNLANEDGTPNIQFVMPKSALLVYRQRQPSLMKPSAGYIFAWEDYAQNAYGIAIKRFRMEHLESDRIEGTLAFDAKIVAPDLGAFFRNTVA